MVKRIVFFIALFCIGVVISIGIKSISDRTLPKKSSVSPQTIKKVDKPVVNERTALFVPYWNLTKPVEEYDRYFYFGIAPTLNGINNNDVGYKNFREFADNYYADKSYLTIRMLDTDLNGTILANTKAQKAIIADAVKLATDNGFAGIALDLEYSGLFDGAIPGKISTFSHLFYNDVKDANLKYSVIIYGDAYYRRRPYDLKELSKNADEIVVMAYDFHKSRGESGPNFPFTGREKYGYDFKQLSDDFKHDVPAEKLTIAFGMFGYEWTVDELKRPIKPADALSLNEIAQKYEDQCAVLNCLKRRDTLAGESEIEYVEKNGDYHIIWHEDTESVKQKKDYSKSQGIGSFALWANGYF